MFISAAQTHTLLSKHARARTHTPSVNMRAFVLQPLPGYPGLAVHSVQSCTYSLVHVHCASQDLGMHIFLHKINCRKSISRHSIFCLLHMLLALPLCDILIIFNRHMKNCHKWQIFQWLRCASGWRRKHCQLCWLTDSKVTRYVAELYNCSVL